VAYAQPFDPSVVERHLKIFGDDVLQHQDFARAGGECGTFGILLVRWKGEAHQYELIREIESQGGCQIFNPHVVTIEDGGMKTIDTQQIDFKKRSDPMGLMNPGKTRGWMPTWRSSVEMKSLALVVMSAAVFRAVCSGRDHAGRHPFSRMSPGLRPPPLFLEKGYRAIDVIVVQSTVVDQPHTRSVSKCDEYRVLPAAK
jgi:hypothetical protein